MKHSTQYLFNIEPQELLTMLYPEALAYKLSNGKILLHKLVYQDNHSSSDERVNKVLDAIEHTKDLIKEMKQ